MSLECLLLPFLYPLYHLSHRRYIIITANVSPFHNNNFMVKLNMDPVEIGLIFFGGGLAYSLCSILVGLVVDKFVSIAM